MSISPIKKPWRKRRKSVGKHKKARAKLYLLADKDGTKLIRRGDRRRAHAELVADLELIVQRLGDIDLGAIKQHVGGERLCKNGVRDHPKLYTKLRTSDLPSKHLERAGVRARHLPLFSSLALSGSTVDNSAPPRGSGTVIW